MASTERLPIMGGQGSFVMTKFNVYPFFPLIRDKCQGHKTFSVTPYIYVMHFKLVGLTSTDRYFIRKRDIERSQTGAKPLVRGQGAKSLEAECVSINHVHFIDENSMYPPISAISTIGKRKTEMSTGMLCKR